MRQSQDFQDYWDDELGDIYPYWYCDRYNWEAYVDVLLKIARKRLSVDDVGSFCFLIALAVDAANLHLHWQGKD